MEVDKGVGYKGEMTRRHSSNTFGFTSTLHRMNCVHPNSANLFCGDQLLNLQPLEAKTGRLWNDKLPNTSYWDFKFKSTSRLSLWILNWTASWTFQAKQDFHVPVLVLLREMRLRYWLKLLLIWIIYIGAKSSSEELSRAQTEII